VSVAEYCRTLADLMDLKDWHVTTVVGKVADDELATCEAIYGQRRARITLAESWESMTAEDLRSTLVHELVHCHLAFVDHLVHTACEVALSRQAFKVFEAAYTLEVENATDALSLVLAKGLPLMERNDEGSGCTAGRA